MPTTSGSLATLSALAFLGTVAVVALALLASAWFRSRNPVLARRCRLGALALPVAYGAGLGLASVRSREVTLAAGVEKYFCELDCHLAYVVTAVHPLPGPDGRIAVVLRTRFDEATIGPRRPREAPTWPAPRRVALVLADGREVAPVIDPATVAAVGVPSTPLTRELRPGEAYETVVLFDVPAGDTGSRLWLTDDLAVSPFLIGHERSPGHARVLLPLPALTVAGP